MKREPSTGNPSKNLDGYSCPTDNYAPLLPSSLYVIFSHPSWSENSYVYESMDERVVNCDDTFWSKFCTADFCKAEEKATVLVGGIMSIPYVTASLVSPVAGYLVGTHGHRATSITASFGLMILVHGVMAFSRFSPILPLTGQGTAYGIFTAVIWSSVPLTVDEDVVGTAYGVMTSLQNTGLALAPMFVAGIHSLNGDSYLPNVEIFFVIIAMIGFASGFYLVVIDSKGDHKLNKVMPKAEEEENSSPTSRTLIQEIDDSKSDVSSVYHELI